MISRLEMFIALAKERHFGRAAESLGITQPTLSAGLRQLEDQLGVKLVQRGSRFGGLTPEGQRALHWARKIVGDSRQLKAEMQVAVGGLSGDLRLAVIPTALTWASHLVAAFAEKHPQVRFSILSRPSSSILRMIEDLEVDGGISYLDNEPLGRMETVPIYRERYVLLCRGDHSLAQRDQLMWSDLNGIEMGLLTPDMQNRRIVNRALMDAGAQPDVRLEANSTVVLADQVARTGLASILPDDIARFLAPAAGLMAVPIQQTGDQPSVGLVAPHRTPHTPVMKALLDITARLKSSIG